MTPFQTLATLCLVLASPAFAADDQVFAPPGQPLPAADSDVSMPAVVSRDAARAMVENGAEVEQVSEADAISRAANHGVMLEPNSKGSPNYGHPWAIIKTGVGFPSGINLLAEIYINDNWSIEPGVNLTVSYGAVMIGPRWHPDALCWNCKGTVSFTLSPGIEVGHASAGEGRNAGTIITGSGEAEFRYRPSRHFILAAGVRASGGTYIDDPYTSTLYNPPSGPTGGPGGSPAPAPNPGTSPGSFTTTSVPAKASLFGDALFYIGVGF
ncbi:MAG: hypothetical protein HY074_07790 [Deltaproteobacteria bacterium]|nr:hypothetical protein [Deltaproteobacteria bacterium]